MEKTYKEIKVGEIEVNRANSDILKKIICIEKEIQNIQEIIDSIDTKIKVNLK